jgi:NNP family nitrate/nitrite transporter-like MFS transporter
MGFDITTLWRAPHVNPINMKARSVPALNPFNMYGRVFFFSWFGVSFERFKCAIKDNR